MMKISIDDYEELYELMTKIKKNAIDPEYPIWLVDHPEYDESFSFCRKCRDELLPEDAVVGDDWYGGYDASESDSCVFCEKCSVPLDYTLTDYGVESELAHYTDFELDSNNPIECFHIQKVYESLCNDEQRIKLLDILRRSENKDS